MFDARHSNKWEVGALTVLIVPHVLRSLTAYLCLATKLSTLILSEPALPSMNAGLALTVMIPTSTALLQIHVPLRKQEASNESSCADAKADDGCLDSFSCITSGASSVCTNGADDSPCVFDSDYLSQACDENGGAHSFGACFGANECLVSSDCMDSTEYCTISGTCLAKKGNGDVSCTDAKANDGCQGLLACLVNVTTGASVCSNAGSNSPCLQDSDCQTNTCDQTSGAFSPEFGACKGFGECVISSDCNNSSKYCTTAGACSLKKSNDETSCGNALASDGCQGTRVCLTTGTSSICSDGADNSPCVWESDCVSGSCDESGGSLPFGICFGVDECKESADCKNASEYCTTAGSCAQEKANGELACMDSLAGDGCQGILQCLSNGSLSVCSNGAEGSPCALESDCASGACDETGGELVPDFGMCFGSKKCKVSSDWNDSSKYCSKGGLCLARKANKGAMCGKAPANDGCKVSLACLTSGKNSCQGSLICATEQTSTTCTDGMVNSPCEQDSDCISGLCDTTSGTDAFGICIDIIESFKCNVLPRVIVEILCVKV